MKKPERRLFVSVACAAALMVCGAVMMHLDKKPDEEAAFVHGFDVSELIEKLNESV